MVDADSTSHTSGSGCGVIVLFASRLELQPSHNHSSLSTSHKTRADSQKHEKYRNHASSSDEERSRLVTHQDRRNTITKHTHRTRVATTSSKHNRGTETSFDRQLAARKYVWHLVVQQGETDALHSHRKSSQASSAIWPTRPRSQVTTGDAHKSDTSVLTQRQHRRFN